MSISRQGRGWLSPRIGLVGVAGAALLATTVAAPQASSAPADPNCPTPVPMRAVSQGMPVHGLTVTSGTTPESFQGEVLGVLQDGIAPGLDMIMVRVSGSEVTDADGNVDKGIWAGMSGSPVYDGQGRLLGAVAYGLSWSPSDVAGITPGVQMMKLLNGSAGTLKTARTAKVAIPGGTADRLVSQGTMTTAQASSGFHRLPMPFSVSGLSQRHLDMVAKRANIHHPMVTGSSTSAASPSTDIIPGGNLAAALSYGDITYAGIGTATAVCDRNVLAFGHPMLWSGGSMLSMHGADAIYIQKDTLFGSFKVANVTAPVGRLVGDHLAGIHGRIGRLPSFTDVTSHVTATNGNARNGETKISYRPYTPFLSSLHLLANADRVLDKFGQGTATVKWTFDGTRADGSSWTYTRQDRFASHRDITIESIWESYRQMGQILHNKFERVRITDVHYNAEYSPKYSALEISKFEIKPGAKWITITSHRLATAVHAGTDLPVRLGLTSSSGQGDPIVVKLSVTIPRKARGDDAFLNVTGGADTRGTHATSFDDLLTKLANAPHNNAVTATLYSGGRRSRSTTSDSQVVTDVVSGYEYVRLIVK